MGDVASVQVIKDAMLQKPQQCSAVADASYHLLWYKNAGTQLVEALRYKLEGRGFDSRWCDWDFH
jgi:hypothetical protein